MRDDAVPKAEMGRNRDQSGIVKRLDGHLWVQSPHECWTETNRGLI